MQQAQADEHVKAAVDSSGTVRARAVVGRGVPLPEFRRETPSECSVQTIRFFRKVMKRLGCLRSSSRIECTVRQQRVIPV